MTRKGLLIVDGHALLHRAFHALPPLTNKKGKETRAIFGFFSIFLSLVKEISPRWLLVCFDSPTPTFRHREFIGYQAKRALTAKELSWQIKRTEMLLKEAQVSILIKPGFEADDLIATAIKKVAKRVGRIFVATGDKDLMQLVSKKTSLLLLQRQMGQFLLVDSLIVKEKLGVEPNRVVDLKGLTGDSSDNYPGVPGIGPKTAISLLEKYGSFSGIYRSLNKVSPPIREKLLLGRRAGELSLKLALIFDQVPIKLKLHQTRWKKGKLDQLKEVLEKEGFPSLVKRIEKAHSSKERMGEQPSLFK